MSELQVGKTEDLWVQEAEAHRALYRDEKGVLRQNPIHVAAAAEKIAFEGSLCELQEVGTSLAGGPPTFNVLEAGLRVVEPADPMAPSVEEMDRDPAARQAALAGQQSWYAELEARARSDLALSVRSKLVTVALGTARGRTELLPGIRAGVADRLARRGYPVDLGAVPCSAAVLAAHCYKVQVFAAASCNPRYSPAEAAVAVLSSRLLRQLGEHGQCADPLYLDVRTVDECWDRAFGWAARVVRAAPPQIASAQEPSRGEPVPGPAESTSAPRFRVFAVYGGQKFTLRVPGGPPLQHPGGQGSRTVWSSLLTTEEAAQMVAQVSSCAEILEIDFREPPKPSVDEAAASLLDP